MAWVQKECATDSTWATAILYILAVYSETALQLKACIFIHLDAYMILSP